MGLETRMCPQNRGLQSRESRPIVFLSLVPASDGTASVLAIPEPLFCAGMRECVQELPLARGKERKEPRHGNINLLGMTEVYGR